MTTPLGSDVMPRQTEPDYLDFAGVAELTGLAASTIAWRHRTGQFIAPDITLGNTPGWRPSTVRTWLLERAQAAAGPGIVLGRTDPDPGPAPEYVDAAGAAERVGITPATWRFYATDGRTPAPDIRLGNSPGWRVETIDEWQANRPGPGYRSDLHDA